ncbi:hypothetical protein [Arcanobacterium pinnipediorum]|uniref:Lipoprotein n=1 Tax=Arcanobacterium pinnipediorum TaxID=1503041 RepID=A0ABY5AHB4_9ACTO|nr:hypothetical protein [Arcanobacterium pinnipediorum]USR79579.1 hypothetical protein NG665_00845 [Arcanobacterium pinnipediorum]
MKLAHHLKVFGLIFVALLGLSACELSAGAGLHEDGHATVSVEFHDSLGLLAGDNITSCEDLMALSLEELQNDPQASNIPPVAFDLLLDYLTITEIPSDQGLACRADFETPDSVVDGRFIQETSSSFIIDGRIDDAEGAPEGLSLLLNLLDVKLVIATPGPISQADGGMIDANRAIYTDITYILENGIYVEGAKHGTADFSNLLAPSNATGLALWVWIAIAFALAGGIGLFVFLIVRKADPGSDPHELPAYGYGVNFAPPAPADSGSSSTSGATQPPAQTLAQPPAPTRIPSPITHQDEKDSTDHELL